MTTLRLDLRESATRQSLLDQLSDALGPQRANAVAQAAAACGVPDVMHHHPADVYRTITTLQVSEKVKSDMTAIYETLTAAEAKVHEKPIDQVHFHEVGRAAGIRNVAAICLAFEVLGADEVISTPVQAGKGTIHIAHGEMPIPAPATAVILDGGIPTCEERLEGERCTPTSVAVIKHFVTRFEGAAVNRIYFQGPVPESPHHHH